MHDYFLKIVIIGDSSVKTVTQRFLTNLFKSDSKMTIGVDFQTKSFVVDGKRVKLEIWAFDGEKRFRFLLPSYVVGAHGAIFMYDIGNRKTLAHLGEWLEIIRKGLWSEDLFPIVLAGVTMGSDEDREITSDEGRKVAKQYNLDGFIECSAKTGEHVEEVFEELAKMIIQKSYYREIKPSHKEEKQIIEKEATKRFSLSLDRSERYHKKKKQISEISRLSIEGIDENPLSRLAIEESDENIDISYINLSEHIPYRTIKKKEGEFKVNEFLTLKLENHKTCIYIKGKRFYQCIRLILEPQWDNLWPSIGLPPQPFHFHKISITPNQEFWGHCSNLQAWAENDYDPRLLKSNISFYLLKALSDAGDPKAKAFFQERLKSRHLPAINCRYLSVRAKFFLNRVLKETVKYQPYFDEDRLKSLLESIFSM